MTDGELRRVLDPFWERFDHRARIPHDPVQFPRRYAEPRDAEVAGLIAASLAFGRVAAFRPVIAALLDRLGPHPARTLAAWEPGADPIGAASLRYRWIAGGDLRAFLGAVSGTLRDHGSLEALMARGLAAEGEGDAASGLAFFLRELRRRALALAPAAAASSGLRFLLPDPSGAAACKRHHLFLRWMVRRGRDGVDLGIWSCLTPARLLVPLDTHVFRIARALGLTGRATPGLAAAREITARLARLDPEDPVKYDFALCHLGVSGRCRGIRVERLCAPCALRPICRLG